MKIKSISHVGLTVSNFEQAVKWYSDFFGFKLISEQTLDKKQVDKLYPLYHLHDTTIRLGFLRGPKSGIIEIFEFSNTLPTEHIIWNKIGATHITLDVKNVHKWYQHLKSRGIHFFSEPQTTAGTDWVFLKDPDGNLIELIDLKANYTIIRLVGNIAGKMMAKGKYKKYYLEDGHQDSLS
ncbi:VOC family protein [Chengkuizengella sediminis]|uniref:VOC family protein n=1 Tax=Chengkuizengella sediminis TaxID=1885917 RepID=UPI00138A3A40|nr:VOC family protein [Chengkuizengella sediminis]NDI34980.1 VOC family protein [Chengkuizengella sediminis]